MVDARPAARQPQPSSSSTKQRLEERSAGAVVFRRTPGGTRFLLLRYPAGHWDLPKGNIERGEEPIQTMVREVREETGIVDLRVIQGYEKKIEYFYRRDGKKVHKTVVFFLVETPVEKVTISFEHQDYGWFGYPEAIKTVTYPNARRLIREGEDLITSQTGASARWAD